MGRCRRMMAIRWLSGLVCAVFASALWAQAAVEETPPSLAGALGSLLPWYDAERDEQDVARVPAREADVDWALRHRRSAWGTTETPVAPAAQPGPSPREAWLQWVGWGTLALVLLLAASLLIWAYFQSEPLRQETADVELFDSPGAAGRLDQLPYRAVLQAVDLAYEAEQRRRQGEWRGAVIYLFSHLLLTLDQARIVQLSLGKTNRDYLREAAAHAGAHRVLALVVPVFEAVYFGLRSPTATQVDACFEAVSELAALKISEAPR